MSVLIIRHGLSEANNRENYGSLAFAAESAPLMDKGRQQARDVGKKLRSEYGMNTEGTFAATSKLLRAQETATEAGFPNQIAYDSLRESEHGMELTELRSDLNIGRLPVAAIASAEEILADPPSEEIWFTHGLVIAGICNVLDVHQDQRLIPRFCEVRKIDI